MRIVIWGEWIFTHLLYLSISILFLNCVFSFCLVVLVTFFRSVITTTEFILVNLVFNNNSVRIENNSNYYRVESALYQAVMMTGRIN